MSQEALAQQAPPPNPPTVSPQTQAQRVYFLQPQLSLLPTGTSLSFACVHTQLPQGTCQSLRPSPPCPYGGWLVVPSSKLERIRDSDFLYYPSDASVGTEPAPSHTVAPSRSLALPLLLVSGLQLVRFQQAQIGPGKWVAV